jgi:hypothetical protein
VRRTKKSMAEREGMEMESRRRRRIIAKNG